MFFEKIFIFQKNQIFTFFSMLKGNDIFASTMGFPKKLYGFLDTTQLWNLYRDELVERGLVPISTRGEDAKLIMVTVSEKIEEMSKDVQQYIRNQLDGFKEFQSDKDMFLTIGNFFKNLLGEEYLSPREKKFLKHVFNGDYELYKKHWIARHEALKSLFSDNY